MRFFIVLTAALFLPGCPPKAERGEHDTRMRPCTKFGENCEYSPGKLGTCIERENCTGGNCLFCQSQH